MPGRYLVFEGIVGTGKTTHSKHLAEVLQQEHPEQEVIWTREPGGDSVAEAIREIAQAKTFDVPMDPVAEAYLFAAARAQLLRSVVKPALERGATIISDRNYVSSIAFQGFGRELGFTKILKINEVAIAECKPDLILFLDTPLDVALTRTSDKSGDKFESLDRSFFEKVREGYQAMSEHPWTKDIWRPINANRPVEEVFADILKTL